MQYGPPKKSLGIGWILAIIAGCIAVLCVAFVVFSIAVAPKSEFERCVRDDERGLLHHTRAEAEKWCRTMKDLENLPQRYVSR